MDNLICRAIEALAGQQATDIHEVYRLFGGEGDPDLMPVEVRKLLYGFMPTLGYRQVWVIEDGVDEGRLMWVRDPWPVDVGRLRRSRHIKTYSRL